MLELVLAVILPLPSMAAMSQLMEIEPMVPVLAAAVLTHPLALLPFLVLVPLLMLQAPHMLPALAVATLAHAETSPFLAATSLLTPVNLEQA